MKKFKIESIKIIMLAIVCFIIMFSTAKCFADENPATAKAKKSWVLVADETEKSYTEKYMQIRTVNQKIAEKLFNSLEFLNCNLKVKKSKKGDLYQYTFTFPKESELEILVLIQTLTN